jgi:hypothetical protein
MLTDQKARDILESISFPEVVRWIEHHTETSIEFSVYPGGYKYCLWLDSHNVGEVTVSDDGQCLELYFQDAMQPVKAHAHVSQFFMR